ncbi:hypothetical protein GEV27_01175 [Aeromicrobium sp. S22]|uniref:hypothetical protein n=1 Tax=Aeromicrobium sp. S22 TaxID=2662029 RepID=UPI00129E619D|nr:hypothetical protein [Aeromicrobium sp. S22]MRK00123.1 hypothetical protein [Aeromicrobium sp. S22]
MRRIGVLLLGSVLTFGLLTPADAARTFSISLSPAPKGATDAKKSYNDTALDVSEATQDGRERTTIRGRVKRGKKAASGRVKVYATNTSRPGSRRTLLGSPRLNRNGWFSQRFRPGHDRAGVYRIEVVKGGSRGYATTTRAVTVRVFQFVEALNGYDAEQPGVTPAWNAPPAYGTFHHQSYVVEGGSTAEFDFTGHSCLQLNFRMARSADATVDGRFTVTLDGRTIVPWTTLAGRQYLPSKTVQKRMTAGGRLRFTVAPHDDGDAATADDNRRVTMVLGRPMVSCTYPDPVVATR